MKNYFFYAWVLLLLLVSTSLHASKVDELGQCTMKQKQFEMVQFSVQQIKEFARDFWPGWEPEEVPIYFAEQSGEVIVFNSAGVPKNSNSNCLFAEKTIYQLTQKKELERKFFAYAIMDMDMDNGLASIHIDDPELMGDSIIDWVTVFVHEFFHVFQYAQADWLQLFEKTGSLAENVPHLSELYRGSINHRNNITKQLTLIKQIIFLAEKPRRKDLVQLLEFRAEHKKLLDEIHPGLAEQEQAMEIFEGVGRFVETSFYERPDLVDAAATFYKVNYNKSIEANIKAALSVSGEYYYATGYGMSKILEMTGEKWKEKIANNGFDALLKLHLDQSEKLGSK